MSLRQQIEEQIRTEYSTDRKTYGDRWNAIADLILEHRAQEAERTPFKSKHAKLEREFRAAELREMKAK